VVREDQIGAAAVDVEGLAQVASGHHRTLDVQPAARDPRARHEGSPGLAPSQREVARVALALVTSTRAAREQLVEVLPESRP